VDGKESSERFDKGSHTEKVARGPGKKDSGLTDRKNPKTRVK